MKAFLLKTLIGVGLLYILPLSSHAQSYSYGGTVQGYIVSIMQFINWVLLPLLFSIALLFFLINTARYFIFKSANDGDREKARRFALYGIGAFVFLVSIWGIVNMFVSGLNIDNNDAMCPDYLGDWCEGGFNESGFYLQI